MTSNHGILYRAKQELNKNPQDAAKFMSKLFFCWLYSFVSSERKTEGARVNLYYQNAGADEARNLGNDLEYYWSIQLKKKKPSLLRAILKNYWDKLLLHTTLNLFDCLVIRLGIPFLFGELIIYFKHYTHFEPAEACLVSGCLFLFCIFHIFLYQHTMLASQRLGIRCKTACASLIYRKILKLEFTIIRDPNMEQQIIEILDKSLRKFEMASCYIHFLWVTPLQLIAIVYLVYNEGGAPPINGMLSTFLPLLIIRYCLITVSQSYRERKGEYSSMRLKYLTEFLSGVFQVKINCFEEFYMSKITECRIYEMKFILRKLLIFGVKRITVFATTPLAICMTILFCIMYEKPLSCKEMFVIIQYYQILHLYAGHFFTYSIESTIAMKKSFKKMERFLLLPEKQAYTQRRKQPEQILKISNATVGWTEKPTFRDVSMDFESGKFYVMLGELNTGKSSFVKLLLNEIPFHSGSITKFGTISLAPQKTWLFKSSLRQNIIFGSRFVRRRYEEVLNICALNHIMQLPKQDKTRIDDSSTYIDHATKAKINFARAVYREADIYIFDAPFEFIDVVTANEMFRACLLGFLSEKTRIMMTKNSKYASFADEIFIITNKRVIPYAEYETMNNSRNVIFQSISTSLTTDKVQSDFSLEAASLTNYNDDFEEEPPAGAMKMPYITTFWSYLTYYTSRSMQWLSIILLLIIHTSYILSDYLYINWVSNEDLCIGNETRKIHLKLITLYHTATFSNCDSSTYTDIMPYLLCIIIALAVIVLRVVLVSFTRVKASNTIHNNGLSKLLYANIDYYRANPGMLLAKYTRDVHILDERLPKILLEVMIISMSFFSYLLLISVLNNHLVPVVIFLLLLIYALRHWVVTSADYIFNIEHANRIPMYNYIKETINGITIIRALNCEHLMINEFDDLLNENTCARVLCLSVMKMLGFYTDLLALLFVTIIICQFYIVQMFYDVVIPFVAYAISEGLGLIGTLQHLLKLSVKITAELPSIQRFINIIQLEPEGMLYSKPEDVPPDSWPETGSIIYKRLYVLSNNRKVEPLYNFTTYIRDKDKVGILGKENSGKYSVSLALLHIEANLGSIIIDGIYADDVGLYELRNRISFLPTKPTLFTTSMRNNIDLQRKCTDEAIWEIIRTVGLDDSIKDLNAYPRALEFTYEQKQLIALARVLVENNRIIIIEESKYPSQTTSDILIEEFVHTVFQQCTVIIVTNKLHNLIRCNRILILADGRLVEEGTLKELLEANSKYMQAFLKDLDDDAVADLKERAASIEFQDNDTKSGLSVLNKI